MSNDKNASDDNFFCFIVISVATGFQVDDSEQSLKMALETAFLSYVNF